MFFRFKKLAANAFLAAAIAACGSTPEQATVQPGTDQAGGAQGSPVPVIQVIPSGGVPEKVEVALDEIVQNNCGASEELIYHYKNTRTIIHSAEVGGETKLTAEGKLGVPMVGEVGVGAELAARYGVSYGSQETLERELELKTGPGVKKLFPIRLLEEWETGELIISGIDQPLRLPYRFRKGFQLEQEKPQLLDCNTSTPAASAAGDPAKSTEDTRQPAGVPTATPMPCSGADAASCYSVEMSPLDRGVWQKIPASGFSELPGYLEVAADGSVTLEFHPYEPLSWNLQFVELTLRIARGSGEMDQANAGIGISLDGDRYAYLKLDSAGHAFVEQGRYNASPSTIVTRTLDGPGVTHTLRVEYDGQKAEFFVDGQPMPASVPAEGWGRWFLLAVSSYEGSFVVADLESVRWGVKPGG